MEEPVIEFHLDGRSGVAPYMQLIHQVRHALRLGLLHEGDQLPKVKDVAAGLAINPNTVLKAYRELEYERLVAARPGVGTFVTGTLDGGSLAAHGPLRRELQRWRALASHRCSSRRSGGWPRRAAPGWTTSPSRPCSPAPFGPQVRRT